MKLVLLFMTVISISLMSCAQNISAKKVPSVVQNAVQAKFTGAADIEWEKKSDLYEAEFSMGATDYAAYINSSGKLIVYKQDIKDTELPAAIMAAIGREHAGFTIDEAEKIEKDGVLYYQVELEASGKKDKELVYAADGTIASTISYIK